MQATFYTSRDQLSELLNQVATINKSNPLFYLAWSQPGEEVRQFQTIEEIGQYADNRLTNGILVLKVAVYFPETLGYVHLQRITPERYPGRTFHERLSGWGIFFMHFSFKQKQGNQWECFLSCNTQKRAEAWYSSYPDLQSPSLWDWKAVESIGRKLRRMVKKYEMSGMAKL